MTYIITDRCELDHECEKVCPVDCIHPMEGTPEAQKVTQVYIDPAECIDCGACMPVCPVDAIFAEDTLPEDKKSSLTENAAYFRSKLTLRSHLTSL